VVEIILTILLLSLDRAACRRLLTVVTDSPRKVAISWCEHWWMKNNVAGSRSASGSSEIAASAAAAWRRCSRMVRRLLVARQLFGLGQGYRRRLVASQHPKRLMPHDTPEPAWKGSRLGKCRERQPRCNERLLHDVLGLLEIANVSQRQAEGE
jgi:hypothetical protein